MICTFLFWICINKSNRFFKIIIFQTWELVTGPHDPPHRRLPAPPTFSTSLPPHCSELPWGSGATGSLLVFSSLPTPHPEHYPYFTTPAPTPSTHPDKVFEFSKHLQKFNSDGKSTAQQAASWNRNLIYGFFPPHYYECPVDQLFPWL